MVIDTLRQGTILIVDDDPVIVQSLGRMLEGLGQVRFALGGPHAFKLIAENPPDIILLDAEMPGLSGYEVCRQLKQSPDTRDIPIIFITGHNDDEHELASLEAGAVDFIGKPPKPPLVQARVKAHLQLKLATDAPPQRQLRPIDRPGQPPGVRTGAGARMGPCPPHSHPPFRC